MIMLWTFIAFAIIMGGAVWIGKLMRERKLPSYAPFLSSLAKDAVKESVKVVAKEGTSEALDLLKQTRTDHEKLAKRDKS